jgi:hypothetical protein
MKPVRISSMHKPFTFTNPSRIKTPNPIAKMQVHPTSNFPKELQVLNNFTLTGLIFSEPSVDGTKYPPTLASKFNLRVGSTAPALEFDDAVDEERWWVDSVLGEGVFTGELEEDGGGAGAPMT